MANSRHPANPVAYAGPAADAPLPVMPSAAPAAPPTQTPSHAITAATQEIIRVTDARGRVIGFRRQLGTIERYRMHQLLGANESENNAILFGFALPAFLSVEIDGMPLPPLGGAPVTPTSRIAYEGRINLLGDEGINAILDWFAEENRKSEEDQEQARADAVAAIKN